jgi:Zn-dependent protease with chaperone function
MGKLYAISIATLGLIASFILALVIAAQIYAGTLNLYLGIAITIVINIIMLFLGPVITDLINRWFYKVKFVTQEEFTAAHPEVGALIAQVATEYKFKFPKIGIIADKNPTAFTYGTARYNARIVFTEGIFHFLNPNEARAVAAHELGHIVNRDFIVMMVASTFVQILYEIYASFSRIRGEKAGALRLIGLAALVFYYISIYLLLFLSRTREYLADQFAAKYTPPQDLANALIKIAYGIVTAEDTESATRLLESTRHLGIMDVKNAKHVGVYSYITHEDPNVLSEVMVFDKVSPWAFVVELGSTHPLTGKRLSQLSDISKETAQSFSYDIDSAIARLQVSRAKLYNHFFVGVLFYFAPLLAVVISLIFLPFLWLPAALGIGILLRTVYKFSAHHPVPTTILDEMRNPYASPVRGKAIALDGQIIGRGVPGFIFGEDMMFQDKTGMTFLDYISAFGFIGNLFFALGKIKRMIGEQAHATGWFFRGMSSSVALDTLVTAKGEKARSYPILWSAIIGVFLIAVSFFGFYYL